MVDFLNWAERIPSIYSFSIFEVWASIARNPMKTARQKRECDLLILLILVLLGGCAGLDPLEIQKLEAQGRTINVWVDDVTVARGGLAGTTSGKNRVWFMDVAV